MRVGPPRWAIGRKVVALARAPQRPEDRGSASDKAARRGNRARLVKNLRGLGVKGEPPAEQGPGQVDRPAECKEPRWAKLGLIGQFGCSNSEENQPALQPLMRPPYPVLR